MQSLEGAERFFDVIVGKRTDGGIKAHFDGQRADLFPCGMAESLRDGTNKEKKRSNRYNGNVWYYVIWWKGKSVQKSVERKRTKRETLLLLLLGIDY